MTGEMHRIDPVTGKEPDGTVWSAHAAIAQAVGGTIQPFDQYQGPYVLVGRDARIGATPYSVTLQGLGVVRLWLGTDDGFSATVYREDTDAQSAPFPLYDEESAVAAALSLFDIEDAAEVPA